jgi:uncharacterized protein YcbX
MSSNGSITSINRYPVKSMGGEAVDAVALGPLGIAGDRRLALRDVGTGKVISAKQPRDGRKLLACSARTEADGAVVVTVEGTELPATDTAAVEERLSSLLGRPVRLDAAPQAEDVYESYWPEIEGTLLSDVTMDLPIAISTGAGTFVDLAALHVVTTASLSRLADLAPDSRIEVDRFRPSLVIDTGAGDADGFVENDWKGRSARLGEATVQFTDSTPRCVMTTLAQGDLPDDKAVLQTLAQHNRLTLYGMGDFACLGIYAEVTEPGTIAVGDDLVWI